MADHAKLYLHDVTHVLMGPIVANNLEKPDQTQTRTLLVQMANGAQLQIALFASGTGQLMVNMVPDILREALNLESTGKVENVQPTRVDAQTAGSPSSYDTSGWVAVFLLCLAFFLGGCDAKQPNKPGDDAHIWGELDTVTVGACSYVVYEGYNAGGVCHAGDCPNPVHQQTQGAR